MKRLIALCGLILVATGVWGAPTEDYLDSFNGVAWSPAGDWLAFTPPEMKELFVISTRNRRSYLLRPLGQVALDTSSVFSPEAPKELRKPEEKIGRAHV